MENTENNNMDMYFSIPDYSKRFLKKKIGKSCIFFSILPYLCKPDTSDSTFKKIQLFCCLKKLELIEKEILKNNNNDEDKLRTIKYIIDSGIKYNKERYISRREIY